MGIDPQPEARLPLLADELWRLSSALNNLAAGRREDAVDFEATVRFAKEVVRFRRMRDSMFESGLFGDPAWDILLDLYVAGGERRFITVTDACIGAAVPRTTALRQLMRMIDLKLIDRSSDPDDGRKVYVALTAKTMQVVRQLLAQQLGSTLFRRSP